MTLGNILTNRAYVISGGKTVEQLKIIMASGSLEGNQLLLSNIQSFVYFMIFGTIAALIITVMLYSLSRMLVWEKVIKNNFSWKNFKLWNGLTLVLCLLAIVYFLIFAAIKLILNFFTILLGETLFITFAKIIDNFFFIVFIIFMYALYLSFSESHKVWQSVGQAFHLIKAEWSRLWKMFILAVLTIVIVTLLLYFLQRFLIYQPGWILPAITIIVIIFMLAWMRLYLLRMISHGTKKV